MSQGAPCWLLWAFYICLCILLFLLLSLLSLLLLLLLLLLVSFLLFLLLLEFLSRAVYCSSEASWLFGFTSFNFFICLNLIHATIIWCWRTILILSLASFSYGDMKVCWCHLSNIMPDSAIICLILSPVIIER